MRDPVDEAMSCDPECVVLDGWRDRLAPRADGHLVYILSPYTHPDPAVRQVRWQQAAEFTGRALAAGWNAYSPIAHSHWPALYMGADRPAEFWLARCRWYLDRCTEGWVLKLPGWEESRGIAWELEILDHRGVEIAWVTPDCRDESIPRGPLV